LKLRIGCKSDLPVCLKKVKHFSDVSNVSKTQSRAGIFPFGILT